MEVVLACVVLVRGSRKLHGRRSGLELTGNLVYVLYSEQAEGGDGRRCTLWFVAKEANSQAPRYVRRVRMRVDARTI